MYLDESIFSTNSFARFSVSIVILLFAYAYQDQPVFIFSICCSRSLLSKYHINREKRDLLGFITGQTSCSVRSYRNIAIRPPVGAMLMMFFFFITLCNLISPPSFSTSQPGGFKYNTTQSFLPSFCVLSTCFQNLALVFPSYLASSQSERSTNSKEPFVFHRKSYTNISIFDNHFLIPGNLLGSS